MDGFPSSSLSASGKLSANDGGVPREEKVHSLIIVAQDQPELWLALARQFAGNPTVQVLQDRRRWERRQRIQRYESDQRGTDRRHPPRLEHDVRHRSFVIIRRQDATLGG